MNLNLLTNMAFVSLNCGVGEFTPVVNQSQPLGLASF